MFSEEDAMRAEQVRPFGRENDPDATLVNSSQREDENSEYRPPLLATAVVIFSTILLTAPKGAVLNTAILAVNAAKAVWSQKENSSRVNSVGQASVSINANNSNVQSVQIINNGGQVSVTPTKK